VANFAGFGADVSGVRRGGLCSGCGRHSGGRRR
jgi:hypothetical protein